MSEPQSLSTFAELVQWGQNHYRDRHFKKEDPIPTRPGLLYFVHEGVVRLTSRLADPRESEVNSQTPTLLGLIGAERPFEIVSQQLFVMETHAHVDQTAVVWFYWNEITQWPTLHLMIIEIFRRQQQLQLSWLSLLGQKNTIERLLSFLALLMTEYGEPIEKGYCLPYALTHAQIGQAIGSTRVTITRLMVKLRQKEIVWLKDDLLCLDRRSFQQFRPFKPL